MRLVIKEVQLIPLDCGEEILQHLWYYSFFLDELRWTQQIQWISTKFKIVASGIIYLAVDLNAFSAIVIESMFPVLPLGSYLLPLTSLNRYLNTGSDEKIFYCCIWEYMLHDQTWSMPNKYATLGFCHNSLNLVKVVLGKFIVLLCYVLYRATAWKSLQ